jgi:hypothetical protein
MITFVCQKSEVQSGQFPIDELQKFSKRTGATVVIRDYAIITYGIIQWLNYQPIDKAMILCEALREVQNEVRGSICQK